MSWPDHPEVPMIKRRQLGFAETLDNGDHGGVDETKRKVTVSIDEFATACVIRVL